MSKTVSELRLFEVCLDRDKKDIMIRALGDRLDLLESIHTSRIRVQEVKLLKEELEKTKMC